MRSIKISQPGGPRSSPRAKDFFFKSYFSRVFRGLKFASSLRYDPFNEATLAPHNPGRGTTCTRGGTEAAKVACQGTIRSLVVREAGRFRATEGRSHRPGGRGGYSSAVTCWPSKEGTAETCG
ncbi:hypothetical protein E2C01_006108 [Portunus trituberculatus]|uniref:Uncharacterized protein n=1 Tax=Portunus trituberculatus TaxID=210409 RepID=A0A5B7CYE0_PORTR|nr:hypothetical protein [Portunus trituberculatus]